MLQLDMLVHTFKFWLKRRIEMSYRKYDLDVYLYAKGWYKKTDILSDLKRIYSLRNGIDPEYIQIPDIICCMTGLVFKHLSSNAISGKHNFYEFVMELGPDCAWKTKRYYGEYDYYKQVISKYLSILSLTSIEDVPELEGFKPSEEVLPFKEEE